jgi:hypothetical protein
VSGLDSYAAIVAHYEANYQQQAAHELRFFASQPDLAAAVKLAALATTSAGKRHPHHTRRSLSTLRRVQTELARCDLATCRTFDELLRMVDDAIRSIQGIGELFVYDTALQIGAFLHLEPDKIYLHAGTRVGARVLGFARGKRTLEIDELPPEFGRLLAHEIEDCLCLYKHDLQRLSTT